MLQLNIQRNDHQFVVHVRRRSRKQVWNSNASGLQVLINFADVHVTMDNIKALGNRGGNGGKFALSITDLGSDVGTVTINNSNISNSWAHKGGGLRLLSHIGTNTLNK